MNEYMGMRFTLNISLLLLFCNIHYLNYIFILKSVGNEY